QGKIAGIGLLEGAIILNAGTIVAGAQGPVYGNSNLLDISSPVSGPGTLEIYYGALNFAAPRTTYVPATLELGSAANSDVVFDDNTGILILDNPSSYSGMINPTGSGDEIVLKGISYNSVTGTATPAIRIAAP